MGWGRANLTLILSGIIVYGTNIALRYPQFASTYIRSDTMYAIRPMRAFSVRMIRCIVHVKEMMASYGMHVRVPYKYAGMISVRTDANNQNDVRGNTFSSDVPISIVSIPVVFVIGTGPLQVSTPAPLNTTNLFSFLAYMSSLIISKPGGTDDRMADSNSAGGFEPWICALEAMGIPSRAALATKSDCSLPNRRAANASVDADSCWSFTSLVLVRCGG
mmetsp:Transcript_16014/g.44353  ORF Transcript_16014/g.44353 Transcript_16014/m.44353 type:complete len:218 (+) Transcript_16014:874-1527(+)